MSLKIRVVVLTLLLALAVATTVQAGFDEAAYWYWYSDATYTTEVGWRYQECNWAYSWGEQTPYEIYNFVHPC